MLLSLNEHLGLCSRSWCMPNITATTTLCWWLLRHMYCCVILSVVADMLIELTQYLPLCLPPWHLLYLIYTVCSYCFMFRSNNVCNWPYVQLLIWTNLALIVYLCMVCHYCIYIDMVDYLYVLAYVHHWIYAVIAIFLVLLSESSYKDPCMLSQHYGIMYVSQGEMT